MKFFTILCLLVVNTLTISAQSFAWARQFEASSTSEGRAVIYDYSKSFIYSTGSFQGIMDLDPGTGTSSVSSKGGDDIFISKLDFSGNFLWGLAIGGTNHDAGNSICDDGLGNIYVCGYFSASVDFDPGPGVFNLTSAGGMDAFILKLDAATGNFVWARQFEGTDLQTATSVVYSLGHIYTTGIFTGASDFDPGTGTFLLTETGGGGNAFISKLTIAGNFVWTKELGTNGSSKEAGNSISIDNSGNILSTGYFEGTIDLDPGPATSTSTSNGGYDIYVLKLNSAGNFIWGKTIGSSADDVGRAIKAERPNSDVYITGYFGGTADFDPGAGTYTLNTMGGSDIFISKLNAAGNFVWAKAMGSPNPDSGSGIAIDGNGKLYISGHFMGTVDFDPGAGSFNLTSSGNEDVFVSTLDTTGLFLSAKVWGGTASDYANGIAADMYGLVYTTGTFGSTVDFDPDATVFNLSAVGSQDAFVHKMCNLTVRAAASPNILCAGQTATLSAEGASNYNWTPAIVITTTITATPLTTTIYTLTGSVIGCMSTGTVGITVNPLPNIVASASPSIICTGNSSSLTASGATSYSWIPSGESTPTIVVSPTVITEYYVIGTSSSGCSKTQTVTLDVSTCTGIEKISGAGEISIYPNPANDYISIAVSANLSSANATVEVTDVLGKVIMKENINTDVTTVRITTLQDGVYFFKVIANNQTIKVGKVVKQ